MNLNFILAGLASMLALQTQSVTVRKPSFEVASVKVNNSEVGGPIMVAGGRFVATGVTLKTIVQYAYRLPTDQAALEIVGAPKWVENDRFDIEGRVANDGTPLVSQQAILMLQTLLEERFRLKVHREARDTSVYVLVVGKNGQKLKLSDDQGPPPNLAPPQNAHAQSGIQTPFGVIPAGGKPTAPALPSRGMIRRQGEDTIATGVRLTFVASYFGRFLGRPVIDKTGLDSLYDFTLHWAPGPIAGPDSPVAPEAAASLFPAVEEVGLKLESARLPIEVLVMDGAQRPSEN